MFFPQLEKQCLIIKLALLTHSEIAWISVDQYSRHQDKHHSHGDSHQHISTYVVILSTLFTVGSLLSWIMQKCLIPLGNKSHDVVP